MLMLDLLGPYCDSRIMNMSCWMSSGNDNPSIVYILCVLHTLLLYYVFLVETELFLALSGKNGKHYLLLCDKYYVTAGIYCELVLADSVD